MKRFSLYHEKPNIISVNRVWVCIDSSGPWIYIADSSLGLLWNMITEWKSDKNIGGY